jgi:hypothetical protein
MEPTSPGRIDPPHHWEVASRWALVFFMVLAIPGAIFASRLKIGSASVESWLPDGYLARQNYDKFLNDFGNDHLLLVSWTGCFLDDDRLALFVVGMREHFGQHMQPKIESITSSKELVDRLMAEPTLLSLKAATERLRGFAIGPEGTCAVMLTLTPAGVADRAGVVESIRREADRVPGLTRADLHFAGSVYQTLAIDEASAAAIRQFLIPSSFAAFLVAWLCLRRLRRTIEVLVLAGIGQMFSASIIQASGGELTAVLIVLPTVVFMLTLSAAIHLTNYFLDSGGDRMSHAGVVAVQIGWTPCVLCTLTTVFGFGSLLTSQLAPVREFGAYSAVALIVATVFLLAVYPAVVKIALRKPQFETVATVPNPYFFTLRIPLFPRYANPVSIASVLLLVLVSLGLWRLEASTDFHHMFPPSSPPIRDLVWIEDHFGPVSSVEVLVTFPWESNRGQPDMLAEAEIVDRFAESLREIPEVGSVFSALTLMPALPRRTGGIGLTIRRTTLRRQLSRHQKDLLQQQTFAQTNDGHVWRITVKVSERSQGGFDRWLAQVEAACHETSSRVKQESTTEFSANVTGLTSVISEAHRLLLRDLGYSFLTAFFLITPVIMLIVRSVLGGLLIMIPNVLPVAIVFGGMGWLQVKVDVASILTASVALGIAVDDTLHLSNWFLQARRRGLTNEEAVADSLRHCAGAMFVTSLVCCTAMLPFFFCEFSPTSKFAILLISILLLALVGDLFLLPALLLSSAGQRIFGNSRVAAVPFVVDHQWRACGEASDGKLGDDAAR